MTFKPSSGPACVRSGTVVAPEDLAPMPGQSLIFHNSPRLHEAAGPRTLFGGPAWPAVGLTHALSGADGMQAALFGALPSVLVAPFDRDVFVRASYCYQEVSVIGRSYYPNLGGNSAQ
jgi:hypothetical protein